MIFIHKNSNFVRIFLVYEFAQRARVNKGLIFKMAHFVSVYSIELVICENDDFFLYFGMLPWQRALSQEYRFPTENTLI